MAERRWRVPLPGSSAAVLAVASLIGLAGFLYPFFLPALDQGTDETRAQATVAPLLFAAITGVCLVAMMVTISDDHGGIARSRTVALLGVLVALDATLRLVPGVLGASPIFLLIMLVGAVFGASMGFQMGALTLLFSAFLTGGLGPWLPFQMLVSGWIGLTAGWLPRDTHPRRRIVTLALFGAVWGLLFGALMNLWFWPFSAPGVGVDAGLYWTPEMNAAETIRRYTRFYLVTSLGYDLLRAVGNVVLVMALAGPILRLLERYRARFTWTPWVAIPAVSRPAGSPERGQR
ncbi:MAG: ECF transporter S component [Chloroflexia bacterium]|nr:ECF transporter S component [Chloroflexia bacterium]